MAEPVEAIMQPTYFVPETMTIWTCFQVSQAGRQAVCFDWNLVCCFGCDTGGGGWRGFQCLWCCRWCCGCCEVGRGKEGV